MNQTEPGSSAASHPATKSKWQSIATRENASQLPTYKRFPLAVKKARGCYIVSEDDKTYVDFYGGHAVVGLGHNHPRLIAALKAQLDDLLFYSNLVHLDVRADASAALASVAPAGLSRSFFVNSGAEANESALKIARYLTGRSEIIAFSGGFHGRTLGAVNVSFSPGYRGKGSPILPGHHEVAFGDDSAARALLQTGKIAAVIVEPVQSMAGCRTAPSTFFQSLRAACDQYGTMLIYDEIQTGMGRTGTMFYAPRHGVIPDLLTLGKALAGGVPMAAVLAGEQVASAIKYGDLGTTFGGGPLAAAGLSATLQIMQDEGILAHVDQVSTYLRQRLAAHPLVAQIKGLGLLIGLQTTIPAVQVKDALFERGILTGTSEDPQILRLLPPLTIGAKEVDLLVDALDSIAGHLPKAEI